MKPDTDEELLCDNCGKETIDCHCEEDLGEEEEYGEGEEIVIE